MCPAHRLGPLALRGHTRVPCTGAMHFRWPFVEFVRGGYIPYRDREYLLRCAVRF